MPNVGPLRAGDGPVPTLASMKFGVFYELSVPRPWERETERQVYMNALEQVRLADELGFHAVWAVEHHFLEEYSHCSAPELFLTAAAAQTTNIRVGHGIVVCVPQFNHPVRVAERAAVLDILSGGRLEFGTGRSATWTELGGFRADPDTTKKSWDEYVHTIPQMWMNERFGYEGELVWDTSQPNGQPRRKLDTSRAEEKFGFVSHTPFEEGLRRVIEWYRTSQAETAPYTATQPALAR